MDANANANRTARGGRRRHHAAAAVPRPMLLQRGDTIGEKYVVHKLLGRGGFGEVWSLSRPQEEDNVGPLCIKWGLRTTADGRRAAHLAFEYGVLKSVRDAHGASRHFPAVVNFVSTTLFDGIVMEVGGTDLRRAAGNMHKVQLLHALDDALRALRILHGVGWIHRDVKPSNFVLRVAPSEVACPFQLMMVDFGLAKQVADSDTPHLNGRASIVGTVRYASARVLCRFVACMRDDVEGLVYTFLHAFGVPLPGDELQSDDDSTSIPKKLVCARKREQTVREIVQRGPDCLAFMLRCARSMRFGERPAFKALFAAIHADIHAARAS